MPPWLDGAVLSLRDRLEPGLILPSGTRHPVAPPRSRPAAHPAHRGAPLVRIGQELELLADHPWPVATIVCKPAEFAVRADAPWQKRRLREGRVLHAHRAAGTRIVDSDIDSSQIKRL